MEMAVLPPPPALAGEVAALWTLRGRPCGPYVGLPKPYAEFIVSLAGDHHWYHSPGADALAYREGWLTPLQDGPRVAQTFGALHLVGARLFPAACVRLFGPAALAGSGFPIPLPALLGREADRLRDALASEARDTDRMARLAAWLHARLRHDRPVDWLPPPRLLVDFNWRVDALAGAVGLSRRGLHKRFVGDLGISPKLWLRLGRFDAVLRAAPSATSLTRLATRFGYADQAHMTSEFRRFAGRPPSHYIRSRAAAAAPPEAPHFLPADQ